MTPSIWQLLIVVVLALLLFGGRGKISSIMGDVGKGIKSFRKGLNEEPGSDEPKNAEAEPKSIGSQSTADAGQSANKETAQNS